MDFFDRQDQARKSTTKLVVLFILATIATVVAINAVVIGARFFFFQDQEPGTAYSGGGFDLLDPVLISVTSLITVAVIGGASLFKTAQIHGDGGKVARMLGGRLLDPKAADADENKLLNIVEEISIASGVPVPDVYVMDGEQGINAFAAGSSIGEAAIGVTRGCMEKLNRDELQGVIAHEFSHILNGDMKLNLRLMGIIFGILVIGLIGYGVFRVAPYMMSSRSRSRDDKGAGAAMGLAALAVGAAIWLIGSIGVFFGRWIQASVSRQREYLADASAVQFTRNPAGIRDALRKIGGGVYKARVENRHAGEISHMWFGAAFGGIFSTHPPLPQRITAIDKNWDGSMLKAEHVDPRTDVERRAEQRRGRARPKSHHQDLLDSLGLGRGGAGGAAVLGTILAGSGNTAHRQAPSARAQPRMTAGNVTRDVGTLDAEHVDYAGKLVRAIPAVLREAARDPAEARGLVASLFLSRHPGTRVMQDEILAQKDSAAAAAAERFVSMIHELGPVARLPLLDLSIPALRQLGPQMTATFLSVISDLINADERVEPFEYALHKLIHRHLLRRGDRRVKYASLDAVSEPLSVMLSAMAGAGHQDPREAEAAFRRGVNSIKQGQLTYDGRFGLESLDTALETLRGATPQVKRRVIDAAAATVAADGAVTIDEAELLRSFAAVLDCPMPPLIDTVMN